MKLNFSTFANIDCYTIANSGSTPNWATPLGQSSDHRIQTKKLDGWSDIADGLLYKSVKLKDVGGVFGKGNTEVKSAISDGSPIISAALFDKVFFNDQLVSGAKLLIFLIRDTNISHAGRLQLKYSPRNTLFPENVSNKEMFFDKFNSHFGLHEKACWFISHLDVKNQDELRLRGRIVDRQGPANYSSRKHQEESWKDSDETIKTGGVNKIYYGAPGVGKSNKIKKTYEQENSSFLRVVFHSEYSYADFVGAYKPTPIYKKDDAGSFLNADGSNLENSIGEPLIDYQFVPGPFTILLERALSQPEKKHTLIIEEINRADAASVFGDIFQALDRDKDGKSDYAVFVSRELQNYFAKSPYAAVRDIVGTGLRIPPNMNIVATMNSADQGVRPMDAAFKRRWLFEYMPIQFEGAATAEEIIKYNNQDMKWKDFAQALNAKLQSAECNIQEDRLIGPYFLKPGTVSSSDSVSKLLLYLKDDVLRHYPDFFRLDEIANPTLDQLIQAFPKKDILGIAN